MYLLVTCPFEVDLLWVAPHTVIIVSISLFFHWSHKDCVSIIIITNEEVIVTSCKLMRESSRLIYVGLFCFRWTWDGVEVIPCFLWYFYWVVDWRLFFSWSRWPKCVASGVPSNFLTFKVSIPGQVMKLPFFMALERWICKVRRHNHVKIGQVLSLIYLLWWCIFCLFVGNGTSHKLSLLFLMPDRILWLFL